MSKCIVLSSKDLNLNDTFFGQEITNKENSSSQRLYNGDFSFSTNTEFFSSTVRSVESDYEPHWHSTDNNVISKCDHDSTLNKKVTSSTYHCKQQQLQTFFDSDLKNDGSGRSCTLPIVGSLLIINYELINCLPKRL